MPTMMNQPVQLDRSHTMTPKPRSRRGSKAIHAHSTTTTTPIRQSLPEPLSPTSSFLTSPNETSFIGPSITPARPKLDPSSPFVVQSTIKNVTEAYLMQEPGSVDKRMRAKLFGQGVEGGYLVSPISASWKTPRTRLMAQQRLLQTTPREDEGNQMDPFIVGGQDGSSLPGWDGSRQIEYPTKSNEDMNVTSTPINIESPHPFGLGFDCLTQSSSVAGTPRKYPSGLGSGFAPVSRPAHSRVLSFRQPTPRLSQPVFSLHPASSPLPSIDATTSSSSEVPVAGPVGPAGKRMRQVTYDGNSSRRATSGLVGVPRNNSMGSRSISSSSILTTDSMGPPLSARPIARMSRRNVSSVSSVGTASTYDMPLSPHMYPTSTGQDGASPAFTYQFQPYIPAHHRHVSNLSMSTVDTPALDSSLPSPLFSVQGISPVVTPIMGSATMGYMPQNTYFPSPQLPEHTSKGVQRKFSGLAIQVEGMEASWENPPLSAITTMSTSESIESMQTLNPGHVTGVSTLTVPDQMPDTAMSVESQMGQLQAAQMAAFQALPLSGPGHYEAGSHYMMSNVQEWIGQGHDAHPPPMQFQNMPQSSQNRHVSSPYPAFNGASQYDLQPPLPTARSTSVGYTPMMNVHMMHEGYFPPQPVNSIASASEVYPTPNLDQVAQGIHPMALPAGSSMGLMSAFLDDGDQHTSKKQRTKYPQVGKRLRPGPKPKKVSRRAVSETRVKCESVEPLESAAKSPVLFDPFVQVAQTIKEEAQAVMDRQPSPLLAISQDELSPPPSKSRPLLTVDTRRASKASSQPLSSAFPDSQSAIPRSYLESCYVMYLSPTSEKGGSQTKRYRCNIDDCTRVFPRKSAIHSHIQTHLEDKPFVCTEADCNAAFVRQHDLRRHVRIHSGSKPFPCPCGKGFARGDALVRHRQRGICIGSVVPLKTNRRKHGEDQISI